MRWHAFYPVIQIKSIPSNPDKIQHHFNIMIPLPFIAVIASTALVGLAFIFGPLRAIGYTLAIAAAILFGWLAFFAAAVL